MEGNETVTDTSTAVLARPAPPVWRLAAVSLLPPHRRPRADVWLQRLPMPAIIIAQVLLVLRLSNTAFQDEALYINGGHALLAHWLHGTPTSNLGSFLSGAPAAYPVIAASLDSVGGLWLVRLFSLLCMVLTTLMIRSITTRMFHTDAAGLLAAAAFVVCGPVIFLGAFATFDAVCVACLALAVWCGTNRRRPMLSAVGMGTALAAAATFKYTGAAFIPPVLVIVALTNGMTGRALGRSLLGGAVAASLLAGGLLLWGHAIWPGIQFTTTSRKALFPAPLHQLLGYVAVDVGMLALLAVIGVFLVPRTPRSILLVLTMLAAAALLPASQIRLGEAVSFEKHLSYSALFLAPLAGLALARVRRRGPRMLGVFVLLFALCVSGLSRSRSMDIAWPDVSRVVKIVAPAAPAGRYLSTSSDALTYYMKDSNPDVHFEDQYGLFGLGSQAGPTIRRAVADRDYKYVIFRSGSSGNAVEDGNMKVLRSALQASRSYELVTPPFPTHQYAVEDWYIYRLKQL